MQNKTEPPNEKENELPPQTKAGWLAQVAQQAQKDGATSLGKNAALVFMGALEQTQDINAAQAVVTGYLIAIFQVYNQSKEEGK